MKKAMQISYGSRFEEMVRKVREAGFQYVSVGLDIERLNENWKEKAVTILRILEKHGVKCVQTHLPYYSMVISSEIIDKEMEENILAGIRISAVIGALWCVYHPRTSITSNYDSEVAFADNRKSILRYLECAEEYGIGIALENLPEFPLISPRMPFYTSEYRDLIALTDSFQSDKIGVCWDFGHANLMYWDQAKAIREVGNRIKCTHIHNNYKWDDNHQAPDIGNIEWTKVMKALTDTGYEGPLTLETRLNIYDDESVNNSYLRHNYVGVTYLEELMK